MSDEWRFLPSASRCGDGSVNWVDVEAVQMRGCASRVLCCSAMGWCGGWLQSVLRLAIKYRTSRQHLVDLIAGNPSISSLSQDD